MSYDHGLLYKRIAVSLRRNPSSPLGKLSRELCVSRRTIQNVVHSVTGKTFRDLRGEILLARIKNLLASAPDRKSTRLNSSHGYISYAVFCLKKKKKKNENNFCAKITKEINKNGQNLNCSCNCSRM